MNQYRYGNALEDALTNYARGDFARGQRTIPRESVTLGTFARGQRQTPLIERTKIGRER